MKQHQLRYKFIKPPKAIQRAKLDNIAIVPASALPYRDTLKDILSDLPKGGVLLCHSGKNPRQDRILKSVEKRFRSLGHAVMNLTLTPDVSSVLKTG